ncbi:hypothetical protein [Sphingomonas sp. CLY1604]|uniref:hypothetical protein n=1 Tax=Sphingomonas sp. CLY1604 TaxID=3457786 RepID=UPI003FD88609
MLPPYVRRDIPAQSAGRMAGPKEVPPVMPAPSVHPSAAARSIATCIAIGHRPTRKQTEDAGVRRARCRCCGLQLMRTAISRQWIIADRLG